MSEHLQGRRLSDGWHGARAEEPVQPGDYWLTPGGWWEFRDPAGNLGKLGLGHTWVEHDDHSVSVLPSILDTGEGGWHGYLRRGVWVPA